MPKLSVHLVTWNGVKYIPYLFESLRKQSFKDWELLVIDNGSGDGTSEAIEKELQSFPAPARFVRNEKNLGFAHGHNQAVHATQGEYIQLLNQDMYLAQDYFEKIVAMMEEHPEAGAVGPKIAAAGTAGTVQSADVRLLPAGKKLELVSEQLGEEFAVVPLRDHALHATRTLRLPVVEPRAGYVPAQHEMRA